MNDKGKLQEFCQKYRLGIPTYYSWTKQDGNDIKWCGKIVLDLPNDQPSMSEIIEDKSSKIEAQHYVAKLLFGKLIKKYCFIDIESNYFEKVKAIYLIDLENRPCYKRLIFDMKCIYIGFCNSSHHSVDRYEEWHQAETDKIGSEIVKSKRNRILFSIDGNITDLADHFMTMLIYPVIHFVVKNKMKSKIYIVSSDHAGICTKICLDKLLKWYNITDIETMNLDNLK